MRYYAQLLEKDLKFNHNNMTWTDTGELREAMGTDSVFILDGRNNILTMIEDSNKRLEQMNDFKNIYKGFRIMNGSRFDDSKVIYTTEVN